MNMEMHEISAETGPEILLTLPGRASEKSAESSEKGGRGDAGPDVMLDLI